MKVEYIVSSFVSNGYSTALAFRTVPSLEIVVKLQFSNLNS